MDAMKLKYRTWVAAKYKGFEQSLTDSDIETFAVEFAEWLMLEILINPSNVCNCSLNRDVKEDGQIVCTNCNGIKRIGD